MREGATEISVNMKERKISDRQWDEIQGIFQFRKTFSSLLVLNLIQLHSSWYTHRRVIIYYRYSALGPVWAETRAQSVDWYSSGTLHPGQVLRGSLLLLSPAFRRSHFRHQWSQRRERS